jgi:hypothetical protein
MAGIEKVCEYSGDYPAYSMYRYKRNHIQICPKYRKLFRGAKATLYIYNPTTVGVLKGGGYTTYEDESSWYNSVEEWADVCGFIRSIKRSMSIVCWLRTNPYKVMLKDTTSIFLGKCRLLNVD